MARPKRIEAERERKLARTAELLVQKWSQAWIAKAIDGAQIKNRTEGQETRRTPACSVTTP